MYEPHKRIYKICPYKNAFRVYSKGKKWYNWFWLLEAWYDVGASPLHHMKTEFFTEDHAEKFIKSKLSYVQTNWNEIYRKHAEAYPPRIYP